MVSDECVAPSGAEPSIRHRPPCDVAPSTVFWRWPGNIAVMPSEAGLGSCHDDDVWFPAPSAGCDPAPIVQIGEHGTARTLSGDERVPARWAAVVQVGATELTVRFTDAIAAEIDRVTGPRAVLAVRVPGPLDLAVLAPVADRLVGLLVTSWPDDSGSPLDLSRLPPMPQLRTLEVAGGSVRGLRSLGRHPRLAGLALDCDLDSEEIAALTELPGLVALSISGDHPATLRALPELQTLHVRGSEANLRALTRHRRLSTLVLRGPVEDGALRWVRRLRSLRRLSLGVEGYTDRGARHLRGARQLRTVVVEARAAGATQELVDRLETLPSLARHSTAEVVLDVDEAIAEGLSEPWRSVACRNPDVLCAPPEPADPTAEEVDRLLE